MKIQNIIEVGLRRQNLREELYCQALLALHLAQSAREQKIAWVYLSLLAGCFLPSQRLRSLLDKLISEKSSENISDAVYCGEKLKRSNEAMVQKKSEKIDGVDIFHELRQQRRAPPSSYEFWAAIRKSQSVVAVVCPDEAKRSVAADSSSTAAEIVEKVCARLEIKDPFGFSLFIRAGQRLAPVGEGGVYLMDAVWQAERFSAEQGLDPPQVFLRRDLFPLHWHPELDRPAARLIFAQVCASVRTGENRTNSSQDLSLLAAYQFINENGRVLDHNEKRITQHCDQVMPVSVFRNAQKNTKKEWIKMVQKTIAELKKLNPIDLSSDVIVEKVVRFALNTWSSSFSRRYDIRGFSIMGKQKESTVHITLEMNHKTFNIKSLAGEEFYKILTKHIRKCFLLPVREDGLGRIQIATDEEIINLLTPFSAELHKIVNRMISN